MNVAGFPSYIKKFSYTTELHQGRSVHEEMWVLQMAPLSVALLAKRVAFLDSPKKRGGRKLANKTVELFTALPIGKYIMHYG